MALQWYLEGPFVQTFPNIGDRSAAPPPVGQERTVSGNTIASLLSYLRLMEGCQRLF